VWGWGEVVGGVGRGIASAFRTCRQSFFDIALIQSCIEFIFAKFPSPVYRYLLIHKAGAELRAVWCRRSG